MYSYAEAQMRNARDSEDNAELADRVKENRHQLPKETCARRGVATHTQKYYAGAYSTSCAVIMCDGRPIYKRKSSIRKL